MVWRRAGLRQPGDPGFEFRHAQIMFPSLLQQPCIDCLEPIIGMGCPDKGDNRHDESHEYEKGFHKQTQAGRRRSIAWNPS